jgi:hypothetical protein
MSIAPECLQQRPFGISRFRSGYEQGETVCEYSIDVCSDAEEHAPAPASEWRDLWKTFSRAISAISSAASMDP